MRKASKILPLAALAALCVSFCASAVDRFPRPDFTETKHQYPVVQQIYPRSSVFEYVDVSVLLACLILAVVAIKARSRKWMLLLTVFSLGYFGFFKRGCVCPVGSMQNMAQALFQSDFIVPAAVVLFFSLPLLFALFYGRVFCASVCPLGVLQELVLIRPVKVPEWIDRGLRLLPHARFSMALLLAGTGTAYMICKSDPFIPVYRLNGEFRVLLVAGIFLAISSVVGRPYCRYMCTYGVLLNIFSRFSRWHTSITPDECVKCRLCEDACPYGAISLPQKGLDEKDFKREKRNLSIMFLAWPFLILACVLLGLKAGPQLCRIDKTVATAEILRADSRSQNAWRADLLAAFRQSGATESEIFDRADKIRHRFKIGAAMAGAYMGLVLGFSVISLTIRKRQDDYLPDRGFCFSCGRCHAYCPVEHLRLKKLKEDKDAFRQAK